MPRDGAKGVNALITGTFRVPGHVEMPKVGEVFADRYVIERLVGRGGMGEVFLATQEPLNRAVALKILKAPDSIEDDPKFDERFKAEAAAVARLQHPNTITIYDFGQDEPGRLYIVMEFLAGNDLRTVIAHEGIFSAQRAIHVAKQVCKSLREAHAKGIIHRDLKPANVLLIDRDDDRDFVKVLDFGLVKFRDGTGEITLAGKFLGSPKYTSPEALDRFADVDHRADIYAVGILLYAMLTGGPPFDGDPIQVLNAHLHETPRPMYRANPAAQTTPELEALVARCLQKAPEKRPQTMGELLQALREVGSYFGDEHTETLDLDLSEPGENSGTGGYAMGPDPIERPAPPPPGHALTAKPAAPDVESLARPLASPRTPSRRGLIATLVLAALTLIAALAVFLLRSPTPAPRLDPGDRPHEARPTPDATPPKPRLDPGDRPHGVRPTPASIPPKPRLDPGDRPHGVRPTPASIPPKPARVPPKAAKPKPPVGKPKPPVAKPTPTARPALEPRSTPAPTPDTVPAGYKQNPY